MSTSESITCPKCDRPVSDSKARFCSECGERVRPDETSVDPAERESPPQDQAAQQPSKTSVAQDETIGKAPAAPESGSTSPTTEAQEEKPGDNQERTSSTDAERPGGRVNAVDASGGGRVSIRGRSRRSERQVNVVDGQGGSVAIGENAKSYFYEIKANSVQIPGPDSDLERLSLRVVSAQDVNKVDSVFVEPTDYRSQHAGAISRTDNVFIVFGPAHSGKFTCAVKIGLDLCKAQQVIEPKFSIYNRRFRDPRSLVAFAGDKSLSQQHVYILEAAFENGVERSDLAGQALSALNSELRAKQNYLILTTEDSADKLADLHVIKVSAEVSHEQMDEVLQRHLSYYATNRETVQVPGELMGLTENHLEAIKGYFGQPWQADEYCRKLADLSPDATVDQLIECAKAVVREGQEPPRPWFNALSENARLYAMLVVLFESVDRSTLDDIYVTAVQKLRSEGVKLADARDIGLTTLLEQIRAHETEGHQVRFDGPGFEQEARRQIRNHHHLLWSLVDLLLALIETYRAPEHWELRRALGAAIGRLGIYRQPKLRGVLEALAAHSEGGVAAVAGYALDQVCQEGSEYHPFVLEVLAKWVKSGDPDRMWAASAAIWRMYDGLARMAREGDSRGVGGVAADTLRQTRENLTLLAKSFDSFSHAAQQKAFGEALKVMASDADNIEELAENPLVPLEVQERMYEQLDDWAENNIRAILHAIHWMAVGNARDVVSLLRDWLGNKEDQKLRAVGELAALQLFEENSGRDLQLLEDRHLPLLDLVGPLLLVDDDATRNMFRALLDWVQCPGWAERIHGALLRVANRATSEQAGALRDGLLEYWLDSGVPDAQHIMRSVLTRLAVMSGRPVEIPSYRHAVIALDASAEAVRGRSAARVGCRLHAGLDPLIDTYLVRMGQITPLGEPGQPLSAALLQPDHARSRLLYEPLDALNPAATSLSVALTTGLILDHADVYSASWADRLIVAAVGERSAWLDTRKAEHPELVVFLSSFRSHLTELENKLNEQLVRYLAARSADEWRAAVGFPLKSGAVITEGDDEVLTELVGHLDQIEYEGEARQILGTIFWIAASDPARCVALLRSWLLSPDELCARMGTACATALFELYAARQRPPAVAEYACLLELAPSLGSRGWQAVEVVLRMARAWAAEPGWGQRLFARPDGMPSELVRMVHTVLPDDRAKVSRLLTDWMQPSGDKVMPLEPVVRLARLLLIQMAAGTHTQLPELPPGSTYSVVLLDARGEDKDQAGLLELAAVLFEGISERFQQKVQLLVYRLGELGLVAGPGEKPKPADLAPPEAGQRPRLLGPLLEQLSLPQIGFSLFLSSAPALDEEDWRATAWSSSLLVYGRPSDVQQTSVFKLVPSQAKTEDAKRVLLDLLAQQIGA